MENFSIYDFPMPPTVNRAFSNTNNSKRPRVKSAIYLKYLNDVTRWYLTDRAPMQKAREMLAKYPDFIRVDTFFLFKERQIFTKSRKIIQMDASNRIKICHDVLAKYLGVDDSSFFQGFFGKYLTNGEPRVHVHFSPLNWAEITKFLE